MSTELNENSIQFVIHGLLHCRIYTVDKPSWQCNESWFQFVNVYFVSDPSNHCMTWCTDI